MANNRNTEKHCSCGHRLRTALELDVGLCSMCLYRENEEDVLVPMEDGESFEWESELKREERLLHESQRRRA